MLMSEFHPERTLQRIADHFGSPDSRNARGARKAAYLTADISPRSLTRILNGTPVRRSTADKLTTVIGDDVVVRTFVATPSSASRSGSVARRPPPRSSLRPSAPVPAPVRPVPTHPAFQSPSSSRFGVTLAGALLFGLFGVLASSLSDPFGSRDRDSFVSSASVGVAPQVPVTRSFASAPAPRAPSRVRSASPSPAPCVRSRSSTPDRFVSPTLRLDWLFPDPTVFYCFDKGPEFQV